MALDDQLGFESQLVLMKIGHDMRDKLNSSVEAPLPDAFEPLIERIGEGERPRNEITLVRGDYRWSDDEPLT